MQSVNLQKVINSNAPAVIRLTAQQVKSQPYMKVGEWLKALNDTDLEYLGQLVDAIVERPEEEEVGAKVDAWILLTLILVQAEGLDVPDSALLTQQMNALAHFLTLEKLYRKGLIDVMHDNLSLGDDVGELPVASLKGEM